MLLKRGQKGFFSLEYAAVFTIIVAALVGMAIYFQRALCSRWRQAADVFGSGRQYERNVTQEN